MILTTALLLLLTCSYATNGVEVVDDSLTSFFRLTLERWRFHMHHGLSKDVPRLAPFYYEEVFKTRFT